jgi:hypothetical protein
MTLTERLVALLGLGDDVTEDEIMGAVGRLQGEPSTSSESSGEMAQRQAAALDLSNYFATSGCSASTSTTDMTVFAVAPTC